MVRDLIATWDQVPERLVRRPARAATRRAGGRSDRGPLARPFDRGPRNRPRALAGCEPGSRSTPDDAGAGKIIGLSHQRVAQVIQAAQLRVLGERNPRLEYRHGNRWVRMDRTIPSLSDRQPKAYRSTWNCRECGECVLRGWRALDTAS